MLTKAFLKELTSKRRRYIYFDTFDSRHVHFLLDHLRNKIRAGSDLLIIISVQCLL